MRSRVRCNVPSYLTRRGREFYPGTVPSFLMERFGSSSRRHNLKYKTFTVDVIFLRKSSAEMRTVVANIFNGALLHRGDCKTIVLTGKIR